MQLRGADVSTWKSLTSNTTTHKQKITARCKVVYCEPPRSWCLPHYRYSGVWLVSRCGSLMQNDYDIDEWWLSVAILILYGITFRFVAYICMVTLLRKWSLKRFCIFLFFYFFFPFFFSCVYQLGISFVLLYVT